MLCVPCYLQLSQCVCVCVSVAKDMEGNFVKQTTNQNILNLLKSKCIICMVLP